MSDSIKPGELLKADDWQFRYELKSGPEKSNLDLLTYGFYRFKPGACSEELVHWDEEAILFTIEGEYSAQVGKEKYSLSHYDVVYIPRRTPFRLKNCSETEGLIIVCKAPAEKDHPAYFASWKDYSADESRIRHLNGKDVFLMFDVSESADKLMAGYTIYEPYTRAWPAHNHTDQEEVYIFTQGRGSMEVYPDEEHKTFVHNVDTMDAVTIPLLNYHPVFSQGEELHFIWCIAGERYWVGDKNKDFMKGGQAEMTT